MNQKISDRLPKTDFGMPTLLELDGLDQCVELCKLFDLDFIELNMNFPQYRLQNLNTDELKKIIDKTGIYFTIHLEENLNISDFNEYVALAYRRTVLETIALAKEIKAPVINMHLAKGIYVTLPDKKVYLYEKYKELYLKNILEFREMCEKAIGNQDIAICVENTEGFMPHEKEAICLLFESSKFKLTFDIGHSHVVGDKDEAFYLEHKEKLAHMHVHDADSRSNHLALGDGEIDLRVRLYLAKNQNCRVVLETKTMEALKNSLLKLPQYLEPGMRLNTTPVLETERLKLRPLSVKDSEAIFQNWTSDPQVAKYMIWNLHQSPDETRQWLQMEEDAYFTTTNYTWAFILKETGEIIGSGGIHYNDEKMKYEIGYNIMQKYWNQGYTTEATGQILQYAIETLGIPSFLGRHAKDNPASGKVMEKFGFVYEKDGIYQSFGGLKTFDSKEYRLDVEPGKAGDLNDNLR